MSALTWPSDLAPFVQSFWLRPHVGRSESPFTRQQKVYGLSAPLWTARVTIRGAYDGYERQEGFGRRMDALVARMKGGENSVTMWDFRRPGLPEWETESLFDDLLGFDDDTGFAEELIVNDAIASGAVLVRIPGAVASGLAPDLGDYVGGDGRPHLVTDRYAVAGDILLEVEPAFRAAVAAGDATFVRVAGTFRVTADDAGDNSSEVGQLTQYSIDLVEAI